MIEDRQAQRRRVILVAAALSLGPCLANGLARFSYALLLPAMRSDLGWSYAQAGWLNTANALGYLLGALLTLALARHVSTGALYRWGMIVTACSLAAAGAGSSLPELSAARIISGIGSAPVFISGGVLAAQLAQGDRRLAALAITIYFGGSGLGILAAGALVPAVLQIYGIHAWRESWIALGAGGLVCAAIAWRHARAGRGSHDRRKSQWNAAAFLPTLIAYFLFAAGYIVYMTFVIAWLREGEASLATQVWVWMVLGAGVCLCPLAWTGIVARLPRNVALAAACAGTGIGAIMALAAHSPAALAVSAAVFGLSFFAAPVAVTAFIRRAAPEPAWNSIVALHTVSFAFGQILGPTLAGAAADASGSLGAAMWLGVVLLFAGAWVALLQPEVDHSAT